MSMLDKARVKICVVLVVLCGLSLLERKESCERSAEAVERKRRNNNDDDEKQQQQQQQQQESRLSATTTTRK